MKEKQIYLLKSFLFECFAVLLVISEVITMNDLSIVMKRKKHVEVLKNNNIDYVQTSNVLPDFDGSSYNIYFSSSINVPQVDELLDLYLRKDGGGGIILVVEGGNSSGYDVVFLLGNATKLVNDDVPNEGVTLYATPDLYASKNGKLRIGQDSLTISGIQDGVSLYNPSWTVPISVRENTIFVCSYEYKKVMQLFGWMNLHDPGRKTLLDGLLLDRSVVQNEIDLKRTILSSLGLYTQVLSVEKDYESIKKDVSYLFACMLLFIISLCGSVFVKKRVQQQYWKEGFAYFSWIKTLVVELLELIIVILFCFSFGLHSIGVILLLTALKTILDVITIKY